MSDPNPLVVIDPDDSIETVRSIRARFADSSSLVVAVPPKLQNERELTLLILKALGKQLETSRRDGHLWSEVSRWLPAHGFRSVVFLCAQHLRTDLLHTACEQLRARGIVAVLVFGRTATLEVTTTIAELLAGRTPPAPAVPTCEPWPEMPRCHPLIFRHRCDLTLPAEQALRATRLLYDCWLTIAHWRHWERLTETQIATDLAVLTHAEDPNEAIIRHAATEIVLLTNGLNRPAPVKLPVPASRDEAKIDRALTETNPVLAATFLAQAVAGLPLDLLVLVHTDQLLHGQVLGIPVPRRARPIIAALEPGSWLGRGRDHCFDDLDIEIEGECGAPRPLPEIYAVLEWLLSRKGARAAPKVHRMNPRTVVALDELCDQDVLYRDRGTFGPVYGLTDRAAYSTFLNFANRPRSQPTRD